MKKINWGMIGGGEGSQIGPAHRLGANIDGLYSLAAGALDIDKERGKTYAKSLGINEDRAYADWQAMLAGEKDREDRIQLVTVATPNSTHYEITKAFLEAGINVLCEKPMTMTVEEARDIVSITERSDVICAVNFGYSGYSLVRHMRAMIARGDLGNIRLVKSEFAHGFHADAADADNPRVRWRYDPKAAGVSAVFADCGIHALHMATYVTGQKVEKLSADFVSCLDGRELEDDGMLNLRMSGGTVGRLWSSAVAIGRMHGLNIQVFGEKGGLRWHQEQPNQLYWTPLNGRTEIIERGTDGLSLEADTSSRVTIGHAEGMPLAFANIYTDLATLIKARNDDSIDTSYISIPTAVDGLNTIAAVYSAVKSSNEKGAWVDL